MLGIRWSALRKSVAFLRFFPAKRLVIYKLNRISISLGGAWLFAAFQRALARLSKKEKENVTYVKNLIYGAIIGLAEIIPGVSGGTFAVLLGIYDNLIGAISRFRKNIKKNLKLLIPLVLGMGISVVGLSFVIKFLLERFPMAVNFFFLGLVLGIVPMLYQKSTQKGFREANLVPFFITLAAMAALGVYAITTGDSDAVIRQISLPVFLKFMAVGCLAAVCLLLPEIGRAHV